MSNGVGTLGAQVVSAGLTVASIGGAWASLTGIFGILPVIIAALAGLAAIVSYTFSILDSPSFQRKHAQWTLKRKQKKLTKLRRQQMVLAAKLQAIDTIEHAHGVAKQMVNDAQHGVLMPPPTNNSKGT